MKNIKIKKFVDEPLKITNKVDVLKKNRPNERIAQKVLVTLP